ncbi:LysR family transcriptional regulator, partial [Coprobacillus cateniformis]|nr:LysR family transcriptional regulator [Coprobacillus cateniformis]
LGICVLPEFVVQNEMKQHQLKAIEYLTHYSIQSQLIYHKDKWLSPSLKHFIDMAKKLIE